MKILYILLFVIFSINITNAQNWNLINSSEKYNYALNNDSMIYSTIFIDSIKVTNNDSIYFLNKTIKYCPTCISHCPYSSFLPVYWLNQPQFFLSNLKKVGKNYIFSENNKNYVLKTDTNLNAIWLFDTVNNIFAQIVSLGLKNIFGNIDSVKTIKLSSSDTIVISKNNGIIQFPLFDSTNQSLKLIGIESLEQGVLTPKYENIFSFNVNDVFEYVISESNTHMHTATVKNQKYKITDKILSGDSIIYKISINQKTVNYGSGQENPIYSSIVSSLVYVKNSGSFLEKYASQQFTVNYSGKSIYKVVKIGYNTKFKCFTKYYSDDELRQCSNDTLFDGANNPNYSYEIRGTYGEYRGLIESNSYYRDLYAHYEITKKTTLIACTIGNITYGTFYPDSIYGLGIKENNNLNNIFYFYPNPANTQISIVSQQITTESNISIFNVNGQELIKQPIKNNETNIDISKLPKGIYILKFVTDKTVEVRKIVKE